MSRRHSIATLALLGAWFCACGVLGEQRFPPPDFESGYHLPNTATPPARAILLQYVDVVVLLVTLGLASWFVLRKRSRRAVFGLSLFSLAYFGFYRKGCVCAIGSVQNVSLALFEPGYAVPLTVLWFFFAPLMFTLLAGRSFCAAVCPHGALQDLVLLKPIKVPLWLEQGLGTLPFIFLGAGILFAATGSAFVICRYDPFVPLFRLSGSFVMLGAGAVFLLLGLFVGRPYCRFLCPYGAMLRLASIVAKWRVTITPDYCTQCRLCEESCPFGVIRRPSLVGADPAGVALDRARLGWLLALLPVLIGLGAWGGGKLAVPASRLHPTVALAERYADPRRSPPPPGPATPDALAIGRAEQDPKAILAAAVDIRRRFALSCWLFGGWVGLVIGARLIALSVRPSRKDYEPDRGGCLGCARCFMSCPNERVRLGLLPASALAEHGAAPASPALVCQR
jgi:polyferredoxin